MSEEEANSIKGEIERICESYRERDLKMPHHDWKNNIYHPRHPLGKLFHEHNHEALINGINNLEINLEHLKILDVGCGYGYWLRYLIELGAKPGNLTGIDLSLQRISVARDSNSAIEWIHAKNQTLPFSPKQFDLVMQVVVFSSILDEKTRRNLAGEMNRITKEGGYILWVDHKKNHSSALAGFSQSKVLKYFPGSSIVYEDSIHPRYFRWLYKRYAWLAKIIYNLTNIGCDSWFFIIKKSGSHGN